MLEITHLHNINVHLKRSDISHTIIEVNLSWVHYILHDECNKPEFLEKRGRVGPVPLRGVIEKKNGLITPPSPNFW